MAASITDPLLDGATNIADGEAGTAIKEVDAASITKPASNGKCYLLVTLLSLASLGLLGVARESSPLSRPKLPGTLADGNTGWGNASCYKPTGGTCMTTNCYPWRDAHCNGTPDFDCVCANGCTGADGKCRNNIGSYEKVAENVRFRNVKWSNYYLYAPKIFFEEQLRVSNIKGRYPDLWNVYKMPGADYMYHGKMFLISPVAFPEYAAGVADTKLSFHIPSNDEKGVDNGQIVIPAGSVFAVDLYHLTQRNLIANKFPFNIAYVMNSLCRPRDHTNAVVIGGALGKVLWYIHRWSWEVFGWVWQDALKVGEGGYWVPEPPLNISLPDCVQ